MINCPFCEIATHHLSAVVLYEDDTVVSVLDHRPISKGHSLVMPKKHFRNIIDIDQVTLCRVYKIAKIISSAINELYKPSGINVIQNNGINAGQTIFHFHIQVIPRYDSEYNRMLEQIARKRKVIVEEDLLKVRNDIVEILNSLA